MSGARVAALYRYPVKSMGGGELARAAVTPAGIPGDRGWALLDRATGRPASAKRFAPLMLCHARFLDEPAAGAPLPPAEVVLPDGAVTRTDAPGADAALSRLLGADVAFARGESGFFDARPLHLLTTATLASMRAAAPLDFDVRRFRPNVLAAVDAPGRPEDAWIGRRLRAGALAVRVLKPVKRCVMTTHAQPALARERGILPAILEGGGALGVYVEALGTGSWAVGDALELL